MELKTEPADYFGHESDEDYPYNLGNSIQGGIPAGTLLIKQENDVTSGGYEMEIEAEITIKPEPADFYDTMTPDAPHGLQRRIANNLDSQVQTAAQIKKEMDSSRADVTEQHPCKDIDECGTPEDNNQARFLPDMEEEEVDYSLDETGFRDDFPSSKQDTDEDFEPWNSGEDSQPGSAKRRGKRKAARGRGEKRKKTPKSSAERQKEYRDRVKTIKGDAKRTGRQSWSSKKHVDSESGAPVKIESDAVPASGPISHDVLTDNRPADDESAPPVSGDDEKKRLEIDVRPSEKLDVAKMSKAENVDVPKKPKKVYYYAKRFKCDMCSHECRHLSHLITHKMIHNGEKPFKCDQCNFQCRQVSDLKKHKAIHSDVKPFKCEQCPYASTQAAYLRRHKLKHTTEKPFKCDVCPVKCKQMSDLKNHKMIHSNDKPFKCDVCSFQCRKLIYLKNHKMTHTDEKPFKCDMCPFESRQLNILKSHQKIHSAETPFKCDKCTFECKRATHLKNHKMIHTGEKPFKCHLCPFECRQSGNLKRHKATHVIQTLEVTFCPDEGRRDISTSSASAAVPSVKTEIGPAAKNLTSTVNSAQILSPSVKIEPDADGCDASAIEESPSTLPAIKTETVDCEETADARSVGCPNEASSACLSLLASIRVKVEPGDSEF